jgi:hypothetical protein
VGDQQQWAGRYHGVQLARGLGDPATGQAGLTVSGYLRCGNLQIGLSQRVGRIGPVRGWIERACEENHGARSHDP